MDQSVEGNDAYRVVYLARSADEVVRRHLGRLCRLRDEGFDVHVLAGDGAGLRRLEEEHISVQPIPVRSTYNAAALIGAYFIIQAYLIEHRPVLVHSFGHRLAWIGTFAARHTDVPAVFTTLEYHWLEEDPFHFPLGPIALLGVPETVKRAERGLNALLGAPYRRSMRGAYRWLGEQVDRYIVTAEFDFQLLQDMELIPREKLEIAIGGAGVDLEEYTLSEQGDPDRQKARQTLGLPPHWRQVVGWVGPVSRRHGADDLVAGIEALRRTHPTVGWLVVPRERLADGQRRRLERLERSGFVRVVTDRTANAELYRAMDLLAWFGRVSTPHDAIAEAAAMAVPTAGYDTPGARSIIEVGQTGHLVFEGHRRELVATIGKLLNDPNHLRELGWRARSRTQLRFSRRAVDEQILRLYDRVLDAELGVASGRSLGG